MTQPSPNSGDGQWTRSRYPGTRPFRDTAEDAALFFGRSVEGEQLYLRVLSVPLLVQFGKSGLGKTSLLLASLFPRLRGRPFLPVMVRFNTPGESPVLAVGNAIQQACETKGLELTKGRSDGLWELLSTTTVWRDDLLLTIVLVFDQFEEVFTLREAAFRAELAAELGALSTGIAPERLRNSNPSGSPDQVMARPNIKIVISLREDYLGELEEFSAAIPGLFHERLRLEPLSEESAIEAVTRPARLVPGAGEEPYWSPPFEIEPSALDSMMVYLKGKSGVIEPFQLQLLCRHAEAIASTKGKGQDSPVILNVADFGGSEGFDTVLKQFYSNALSQLSGFQQRKAKDLCEEGLLDASGHRLMLEEQQIQADFGITTDTLATLSKERLLRRERRLESAFYEISHDRLAESIFHSRRFRLPKKVRRAMWSVGAVALVIVGGLWLLGRSEKSARMRVDNLLGFFLGNFLEDVRDIGRSSMLDKVRGQVEDVGDLGPLNRGLALSNLGDLEQKHGSLTGSVASLTEALRYFEHSPDEQRTWRGVARTHDRLADVLNNQGQTSQALTHAEDAVEAWRSVVAKASPVTVEDCTSLADSLNTVSSLRSQKGAVEDALTPLKESAQITSSLLIGGQTAQTGCGAVAGAVEPYPNVRVLEVVSKTMGSRASILYQTQDFEGAAALAMEARRLNPASISARENALNMLAGRGNERMDTSPQRALDDYRAVLNEFETLRRWDPDNRWWQRQRAAAQLVLNEGIIQCHSSQTKDCKPMPALEEAEGLSLDAIATFRALAQFDPSNISLKSDLAWALEAYSKVLAATAGRQSERLTMLEEAEGIRNASQRDAADSDAVRDLANLLIEKSKALIALQSLDEAQQSSKKSIELSSGLVKNYPDNLSYLSSLSEALGVEAEILRKTGDVAGAAAAEHEKSNLADNFDEVSQRWRSKGQEAKALMYQHLSEGAKLYKQNEYTAALSEFNLAESSAREYISLRPADYEGYDNLRNLYTWIQLTHEKLGHGKEREAPLLAARNAAQIAALLARETMRAKATENLLDARYYLDMFLFKNRFPGVVGMEREEIAVAEQLLLEDKQDDKRNYEQHADYLSRLGDAQCGLGRLRREHGKEPEPGWEESIRSGIIQIEKAAETYAKSASYPDKVGAWRSYLGEQLDADGRKKEAQAEYRLALKAYQEALRRNPSDQEATQKVRDLAKYGNQ